jgi:sulfur carrier protein ThiS
MIRVIPVGMLRRYVNGQESLSLDGWSSRSVLQLLDHLGVPSPLVGAVLIGGQLVSKDHVLQEGEEVKLIPLVGGG